MTNTWNSTLDGHVTMNVTWPSSAQLLLTGFYSSPAPAALGSASLNLSLDAQERVGLGTPAVPQKQNFRQTTSMIIILAVAYAVVFLLGVVNNVLVVTAICRCPQLRTVTNYFIGNLAVADILVSIVVLPITLLSNIYSEWWYGLFLCKATPYLQGVAVGASVNTLAAVAVERYLAIFFPQTTKLTRNNALVLIAIVWIIPAIIFIPWIVTYNTQLYPVDSQVSYLICLEEWSTEGHRNLYFLVVVFLFCYLIPLVFIAIFYLLIGIRVWKRRVRGMRGTRAERNIHKSKIRILRMLIVVFLVFVISWMPLYSIRLRILFGPHMDPFERRVLTVYLTPLAQWLGSSNSCINPFIYCFFCNNFQKSITAVVKTGFRSCCQQIPTEEVPAPSGTDAPSVVRRMLHRQ